MSVKVYMYIRAGVCVHIMCMRFNTMPFACPTPISELTLPPLAHTTSTSRDTVSTPVRQSLVSHLQRVR